MSASQLEQQTRDPGVTLRGRNRLTGAGADVGVHEGAAEVVTPGLLYGQAAPFNVTWSTNAHRVQVPCPTGATSFTLNNNTNQVVRVTFDKGGDTEANTALGAAAQAASDGLQLSGCDYFRVPAGQTRTYPFSPLAKMYRADIKPEANATGNCDGVSIL